MYSNVQFILGENALLKCLMTLFGDISLSKGNFAQDVR